MLITAARDEAQFIELTIRSVIGQTVRPIRWIIVSDGSTDGTDDIVRRYAAEHSWIELARMPERYERSFSGKAQAVAEGCRRLQGLRYEAIGNLDADVSFDSNHFALLLAKLDENPALGVVGTAFTDFTLAYDYRFVSIEHVSGPCQLFRRECFEEIGGYIPSALGGVDHIAVITARMKGWQTRTFTEAVYVHHRPMGSYGQGSLIARFRAGVVDYLLGSHPVWELSRVFYQMTKRPYLVGALSLSAGYLMATVHRLDRPVSREFVEFRRKEQMRRLRAFLVKSSRTRPGRTPGASLAASAKVAGEVGGRTATIIRKAS